MFLRRASRIAWRELHATRAKFLFVILAVAIGVGALSGVKGFGYAFRGMLLRNAKQLTAADLQAQIWAVPTPEMLGKLRAVGAKYGAMTQVTETVSMAAAGHASVPQLVSVKAVDPTLYPFYGSLTLQPRQSLRTLLCSDSVAVVTPELLMRLKVKPGEDVRVGGKPFRIVGTIVTEPDRLASGFGPGMRIIMTRSGLERTGLIQFGSRAAQRFLFKLGAGANLDAVQKAVHQILPHAILSDYQHGDPAVSKAIDNTTKFLSLISLIALIIGSLGVAMAMHSHLQQRIDTIAIMKAMGARSRQVMQIYLLQTLWLGIIGGVLGVALGAVVQRSFPLLMQRVLATLPNIPWDWSFSLQGMSLGVLATLLFTVPPLLGIRDVRPALVFRRNMQDANAQRRWRDHAPGILGGALILLGFGGIAIWLSGSWKMGLYFVLGLAAGVALLAAVAVLLLWCMRRTVRALGTRLPAVLRHGFANLYRPGNQARAVLVALGVGVMFTLTTYLLQQTVLRQVRSEGTNGMGNVFLLDVRQSGITQFIEAQQGVSGPVQLVGYIVSRLVSRNGVPTARLSLSEEHKSHLQTLRLTTAKGRPDVLELQKGHWWAAETTVPQVAISEEAARYYGLKLGDQLQFEAVGRRIDARIVAVFQRSSRALVRYDLVFPQGALQHLPLVYYGAVKVRPGMIPSLEEKLFERYPTVTVMNLADVLHRIQEAVDQVAVVIRFLTFFAILSGVIILSSSVAGTRYRRVQEVAILKTLGATRARVSGIFSVEFSMLGVVAGVVGGLMANVFTKVIANKFIETSFHFDWVAWLVVIVVTVLLANLAGWLASARILGQRPLEVLRGE